MAGAVGAPTGSRCARRRPITDNAIAKEAIRRMPETGFVPVFVATLLSVNYSLSGAIMLLPWAFPGEMRKGWAAEQARLSRNIPCAGAGIDVRRGTSRRTESAGALPRSA